MKRIIFFVVIQLISISAFGLMPDTLFSQGIANYNKELYAAAADDFQQLYDLGYNNFEVCYNLGNAYYKINDMPSAILYYERAKRIMPNNTNVIHNLQVVNKKIIDNIETIPDMFYVKWWNTITQLFLPNTWCIINIVFFSILLMFISLMFVTKKLSAKKSAFWLSMVFLILFAFSVFVNIDIKKDIANDREAIVFSSSVTAKGSPTDKSVDLFVIHNGTKVEITDNVGDWIEIRLSNGKIGWIYFNDIKII